MVQYGSGSGNGHRSSPAHHRGLVVTVPQGIGTRHSQHLVVGVQLEAFDASVKRSGYVTLSAPIRCDPTPTAEDR